MGGEEKLAVGAIEVDLGFEHPGEVAGMGTTRPASGSPWSVFIPSRILPSWAVRRTGVFRRRGLRGAEAEPPPFSQAGVGEDADDCLVASGRLREAVHLLEAEDADRAGRVFFATGSLARMRTPLKELRRESRPAR